MPVCITPTIAPLATARLSALSAKHAPPVPYVPQTPSRGHPPPNFSRPRSSPRSPPPHQQSFASPPTTPTRLPPPQLPGLYLIHGFRWPRPNLRIHVIMNNLEDAAPDYTMASGSNEAILNSFSKLCPSARVEIESDAAITKEPFLRMCEEYDVPNPDFTFNDPVENKENARNRSNGGRKSDTDSEEDGPNEDEEVRALREQIQQSGREGWTEDYAWVTDRMFPLRTEEFGHELSGSVFQIPQKNQQVHLNGGRRNGSTQPSNAQSTYSMRAGWIGWALQASMVIQKYTHAQITAPQMKGLSDIRDAIAPEEEIGWFIVLNSDIERQNQEEPESGADSDSDADSSSINNEDDENNNNRNNVAREGPHMVKTSQGPRSSNNKDRNNKRLIINQTPVGGHSENGSKSDGDDDDDDDDDEEMWPPSTRVDRKFPNQAYDRAQRGQQQQARAGAAAGVRAGATGAFGEGGVGTPGAGGRAGGRGSVGGRGIASSIENRERGGERNGRRESFGGPTEERDGEPKRKGSIGLKFWKRGSKG